MGITAHHHEMFGVMKLLQRSRNWTDSLEWLRCCEGHEKGYRLRGLEVNGTGSGSCLGAGFGVKEVLNIW